LGSFSWFSCSFLVKKLNTYETLFVSYLNLGFDGFECELLVTRTLLCGCVYEEKEWMLVRIKECEMHHKQRTKKVEYRPKAECNRNDTRGE
jgi:hypothetical protein